MDQRVQAGHGRCGRNALKKGRCFPILARLQQKQRAEWTRGLDSGLASLEVDDLFIQLSGYQVGQGLRISKQSVRRVHPQPHVRVPGSYAYP